MFEGLIDGLSQHGAHPLSLHQTANSLFVQDSPDPQLLHQWKHTAALNFHLYQVSILDIDDFLRLTLSIILHLCVCHAVSAGFQAPVHVSKTSECQCLDIGDLKDILSLFLFF